MPAACWRCGVIPPLRGGLLFHPDSRGELLREEDLFIGVHGCLPSS